MSKIDEFIKDNINSFKQEFKSAEECGRIISVQDAQILSADCRLIIRSINNE